MSEWKKTILGEVINLRRGHDLPKQKRVEGGVPIISSSGITGYHNEHKAVGPGVVTGRYGTIGQVFYVKDKYWPLNTTLYVDDFKGNDPLFLSYFLRSIDFDKYNDKSTVPGINRNHLHLEEVSIPPIEEQHSIASILSSLDDKIDLLHRQNQTLEQMAETLFRQWFVEEESEIVPLGDCIKTTSGGTPSRKRMEFFENGVFQWVKSKELNGGYILETEEKITAEALKKSSAKLLPENSVLIAMYGATVGQFAIIGQEATCNQAICACLPNNDFPYTFIYHTIKANVDELKSRAVGSAQQNISQVLIKSLEISVNKNIDKFHTEVDPMMKKIKANYTQIRTLTALRDTLLPKLISGEIRVSNSKEKK